MSEAVSSHESWLELPQFKDAESCVGAGMTWAIKLTHPKITIPRNAEQMINEAKFGECKENIPLSWILGALKVFPDVRSTIYVEQPDYVDDLAHIIPVKFSGRLKPKFGIISAQELRSGKMGVSAVLIDKGILQGGMHIAHTVVIDPSNAGQGEWLTCSDPWSGKERMDVPNNRFDEAIFGLNWLLGWGKMAVSIQP